MPKRLALKKPSEVYFEATASEEVMVLAGDGEASLPTFSMTAYTGGKMRVAGYYHPVVVNLATASAAGTVAILKDHDVGQVVGHAAGSDVVISPQRIKVSGVVSGTGPYAAEVVGTSKNKFPWQASIGGMPSEVRFIDRGERETVNGRVIEGPAYKLDGVVIREVSFVALGADGNTSGTVAASFNVEEGQMTFSEWMKAKGFDEATQTAGGLTFLKALYEADGGAEGGKPTEGSKPAVKATSTATIDTEQAIEQMNARFAANAERVDKINELCLSHPAIKAKAIKENWDVQRTELEVLRANRDKAPAAPSGRSGDITQRVLQAALCQSRGIQDLEKNFTEQELQAAHTRYRGRMGIQQLLLIAAAQHGYTPDHGERITDSNLTDILHAACPPRAVRGASTLSLPGILGDTANREALAGYMEEDDAWKEIAQIKSVQDFRQVTAYRLLDDFGYLEVGQDGELKHGAISEESYTRQAKTYGRMFTLTRQQIINDDLSVFDDIRARLGRGSAQKMNVVFWTEFMDNSSFFTTGRANYITGSTTNLGTDGVGLGLAVLAYRKMTSPTADGSKRVNADTQNPVGRSPGGRPSILLVPPELEANAEILYKNLNLGSVGNSTANIHANKYRPVVAWQLSNSSYTGYSTTAFYLLNDPVRSAPIVVSFLNGQQTPTVEVADSDFGTLGIQFRGYHDFGCDQAEYLCGVKSKGAA